MMLAKFALSKQLSRSVQVRHFVQVGDKVPVSFIKGESRQWLLTRESNSLTTAHFSSQTKPHL
jgi:hypothetical protein